MNGCKGSCITLAAIAGASASIAGGIWAVSSASADAPSSATLAARSATPIQADRTVADSEALAVSSSTHAAVQSVDDRQVRSFEDTFAGLRHKMRNQYAQRLTREFLAATDYKTQSTALATNQATAPCPSCATGATHEDDQLPTAQSGSGLPDASSLDCTSNPGNNDVGWRGKNDHCLFNGDTLFEDPNLKEILTDFTNINQSQPICGTTMNIDNSCHTGDNNGDSRNFDPDVWEFHINGIAALDMRMTAYSETPGIRVAMTYNFYDSTNNATFGPITTCSDGYGIFNFPVWQSFEIRTTDNCADGTWAESLQEGYWYILVFPVGTGSDGPANGAPRSDPQTIDGAMNPDNAWFYNVLVESYDPQGACCDTDDGDQMTACSEGTKSSCLSIAGVFQGPDTTCAETTCCSPISELTLPIDFEEANQAVYLTGEDACDQSGADNLNEIAYDFEGNVINCETTPLTDGDTGADADICDEGPDPNDPMVGPNGDSTYVIVGYSGTEDSFSSNFASDSYGQGDDDVFVFETSAETRIDATFRVPFSYVGYIVRDFGASALSPDCDVVGFLSPGITAPCQTTHLTQCLAPGVHGVYMQCFATANISCQVKYTIVVDCIECAPGACCMKDGTCMDSTTAPECEFTMGGNFQGNWSSCCASTCEVPCDSVDDVNPPDSTTSSDPDDDCTDYTCSNNGDPQGSDPLLCPTSPVTNVGDYFNSGCEAPDGQQSMYWTTASGATDRLWCAHTGTYILDLSGTRDLIGDYDYIELDLSGESDDTQVAITLDSQIPLQMYVARGRSKLNGCPSIAQDDTDDIRELPETISVGTGNVGGLQQVTLTLCLDNTQHMILVETTTIIDCGFSYSIQIDCEDNCQGACCTNVGCTNVNEDSSETSQATTACNNINGVYRGLGTRCPGTGVDESGTTNGGNGNPLGRQTEIECCTVTCDMADEIDDDNAVGGPTCAGVISSGGEDDANGGCVQGTAAAFQSLGTLDPSSGATPGDPGDSVSVCGSVGVGECAPPDCFPPIEVRDRDIYSFDIPLGKDAEVLFYLENNFNEFVRLLDQDDFDPGGVCNFNTPGLSSFTINSATCAGGQTFALSGLQTTGQSLCLDDDETHYIYVAPFNVPTCDVWYRFEITLYECALGACCLDNALCVGTNDVGFVECEQILGGTFFEGGSCPTGDDEGTMCIGACCIDHDADPMTPVVCQSDTLYQACCVANEALTQDDPNAPGYSQGGFNGYHIGYNPQADCTTDPNQCEETPSGGACCFSCPDTGVCTDETDASACLAVDGFYIGDGTTCAGTDCENDYCIADLDGDGDCDVFDFGVFGPNFNTTSGATRCDGDFDCDGDVDVFDFGVFGPGFNCTGLVPDTACTP